MRSGYVLCASTITEQPVKEVCLEGSDKGLEKVTDAIVAVKVSSFVTEGQILADYLSIVPTGPLRHGMSEAACAYFGHDLAQLPLPEYALLAGVVQAPDAFDPRPHPKSALTRRNEVLWAMELERFINQAREDAASRAGLLPANHRDCG